MMEIYQVLIAIIILLITYWIRCRQKCPKLPGPKALPFLGNLHQLNKTKLHVQLLEWAKQYGPVYRVLLGRTPIVIVTGSQQIHEVLVSKGKDFSGRPHSFVMRKASDGKAFVQNDVTPLWKIQKKIFTTTVKAYGSGLQKIEEITARYASQWIEAMENTCDEDCFDMREHLENLTYKIINTVTVRESFHKEENVTRIKDLVQDMTSILQKIMQFDGFLLESFPLIRFILPGLVNAMEKHKHCLYALFMDLKDKEVNMINTNEAEFQEQTLLSNLLQYQHGTNEEKLDDKTLCMHLFTAYTAGILTTSVSLTFLFNILSQERHIQENIQMEIDTIVGTGCIHLKNRDQMPYTHATLLETLRFTSIAPLLVPHRSVVDTSIDGCHIPKDTEVWVNAWGLHHDDALWDQPFTFMPERFIASNGSVVLPDHPNRRNLKAFGAGLRICPGETFAMSRMFLVLTMFLQKFSVRQVSTDHPIFDTRDIDMGIVLEPPKCKLKLQARN